MRIRKGYRKKAEKRRGKAGIILATLLFLLFLMPYGISFFAETDREVIHDEDDPSPAPFVICKNLLGRTRIPLETYLEGMMAAVIPAQYHQETLKAQAVILRSRCFFHAETENGEYVIPEDKLQDMYLTKVQRQSLWGDDFEEYDSRIRQAIEDTRGIIMMWEEKLINPPFFRVSNGTTRSSQVYRKYEQFYEYIKRVECKNDIRSEDYADLITVPKQEFKNIIAKLLKRETWQMEKIILHRDESDYVKEVQIGTDWIDGEAFRAAFGLPSAGFSFRDEPAEIHIESKGMGHGFGFSQFEANEQAVDGETWRDVLFYFFRDIKLEKIVS